MTEAVITQRGRTPWFERVYGAFPVAPAWVGATLAATLIVAFLGSEYALGRHELLASGGDLLYGFRDLRVALVLCLLVDSRIAGQADAVSLADLIAYEARIENVREWPFDTPTMLRFALYLVIPLGSWLGAAFVERLLGAALD